MGVLRTETWRMDLLVMGFLMNITCPRASRWVCLNIPVVSCALSVVSGHLWTYTRTFLISSAARATIVTSEDSVRCSYFPDDLNVFLS